MLLFGTMPQPVKLSDPLVQAARAAADDADRSIAGQIEHWARLGRAVEATLSLEDTSRLKRGEFGADAVGRERLVPVLSASASGEGASRLPPRRRPRATSVAAATSRAAPFPDWLERKRGAIETLCKIAGVRRLGFFGSVLRPEFNPAGGSDVDATVEFRDPQGQPTARQYFDFKGGLEQLLGVGVDLVELAAMPESRLKRIIERTQRTFHVEAG